MTTQEKLAYTLLVTALVAVVPAAIAGYLATLVQGPTIAGLEWLTVITSSVIGWVYGYTALFTIAAMFVAYLFEAIEGRHGQKAAKAPQPSITTPDNSTC